MSTMSSEFFVYILRCADGVYYTGSTTNDTDNQPRYYVLAFIMRTG